MASCNGRYLRWNSTGLFRSATDCCSRVPSVQIDWAVICDVGADSLRPGRCSRVAVRTRGAGFPAARPSGVRRVPVVSSFRMHLRPTFGCVLCDLREPATPHCWKGSGLFIANCCSCGLRQYTGLVRKSVKSPLNTRQSSGTFLRFPRLSFCPLAADIWRYFH